MKKLFLAWILFFSTNFAIATTPSEQYLQEEIEQQTFDEAKWQELTRNLDYSKDFEAQDKSNELDEAWEWKNPVQVNDELGRVLSIGILAILGIVLLVIITRFLLFTPKNKRKLNLNELAISVEEIADNLETHDPSALIQQAIEMENYRLAVRLYFLKSIRELSLKGQITWQKDKTNTAYLQELKTQQLHDDFRAFTNLFERVWYGNRLIDSTDFAQIQPKAAQLLAQIEDLKTVE